MTILDHSRHRDTTLQRRLHASPPAAGALLLGLGSAVPEISWSQAQTARRMARLWNLGGPALDRWQRIVEGSGIERRHAVMPPDEAALLTTGQRMQAYERFAPPLAEAAARRALAHSGAGPGQITDLVVVSCTGFSAPGVDVELIERLGLPHTTRRTTIGFMGCFGAINGLRVASGACALDRRAVALVVCVELCALHMRRESDVQNQVASALFADGAAAAVLAPGPGGLAGLAGGQPLAHLGQACSLLVPEGREWMTWRITDAGFAMTLTRAVPAALRQRIAAFARGAGAPAHATFVVHPGGPGVLDAVDQALELGGARGMECSRRILRRFGNMSSGTVLFVLEEAVRGGLQAPMLMLAFGPGLTLEGLMLERT